MQQILTALRNAASALKKETPSTEKETPSTNPQTPETPNDGTVKVGQVIKAEGQYGVFTYKVTGKDTVEVKSITAKGKAKKSVKIFDKIKASGKTWKVTSVAANALKGNKKMESLTIGKNVRKIGKNAFVNCRKLKKVTIKSKKINTIGKNAFKNINKKATVKVPKAQKKKYAKLLNKAKLSKKVKIK
nr:leucine-rich repeat protein [Hominisplanchenecus faecis]